MTSEQRGAQTRNRSKRHDVMTQAPSLNAGHVLMSDLIKLLLLTQVCLEIRFASRIYSRLHRHYIRYSKVVRQEKSYFPCLKYGRACPLSLAKYETLYLANMNFEDLKSLQGEEHFDYI